MKYLIVMLLTSALNAAVAQTHHRVVMQFSDSDSVSMASVLGQVKNIRTDLPDAEIEVVCHGPGLDLLIRKSTKVPALIKIGRAHV